MKLGRLLQFALIAAVVFIFALSANASSINYDTASTLIGFNGTTNLTLTGTGFGGGSATLVWSGIPETLIGTPTNINYGEFNLTCTGCTNTIPGSAGATFAPFTFDVYVTDDTDGGVGEFIGTSAAGGTVYNDSSTIQIVWTPAQVGPGASGAIGLTTFNTTYFQIYTPTPIVAQNTNSGITTVQGFAGSTLAPEPATMAMAGGLLMGLAALARKRRRS